MVLGNSNFYFRFHSVIQFFPLWSMDDKTEAEPKTALAKYYLFKMHCCYNRDFQHIESHNVSVYYMCALFMYC